MLDGLLEREDQAGAVLITRDMQKEGSGKRDPKMDDGPCHRGQGP